MRTSRLKDSAFRTSEKTDDDELKIMLNYLPNDIKCRSVSFFKDKLLGIKMVLKKVTEEIRCPVSI